VKQFSKSLSLLTLSVQYFSGTMLTAKWSEVSRSI